MQNPELFASAHVFVHVLKLLGMYKFRLPVRRFVYELFHDVQWNEEALKLLEEYY
jgi:hypothetical protein